MATNPPKTQSVLAPDERLGGTYRLPPDEPCPPGQFRTAAGCQPVSSRSGSGGIFSPMPAIEALGGAAAEGLAALKSAMTPVPEGSRQTSRAEFAGPTAKGRVNNEAPAGTTAAAAPPPSDPPTPKVGNGPAEKGPEQTDVPGFVTLPNGRIVTVDDPRKAGISAALAPGWDAKAEAANFMRGRTAVPSRDAIAGLSSPENVSAAKRLGVPDKPGWTFRGGYAEGGRGPREGTGRLLESEQRVERGRWLDRRDRESEADEVRSMQLDLERAKADYAKRMFEMDPLEMERIRAQGKYGAEHIRSQAEASARAAALEIYRSQLDQVMRDPSLTPERRQQLIVQAARDTANIMLGSRVSDPNAMAAMMGALLGMGGAGAATAGEAK